jgi:hypothetical protein
MKLSSIFHIIHYEITSLQTTFPLHILQKNNFIAEKKENKAIQDPT